MYKKLNKMIAGRQTPLAGENENGEVVIVARGENENGKFIETKTAQKNNWIRINTYYADGCNEETFIR